MTRLAQQERQRAQVVREMIEGIWGKPYGSDLTLHPVSAPVDCTDEEQFPNIAEARRHAAKEI
jgi:hypothetical protein